MSSIDAELDTLMTVLKNIQKDVGGKADKESRERGGKVDKFMDLKQSMIARMSEVRQLHASTKGKAAESLQPKEVITINHQIREHMRQLQEDLKELDRLYGKEKGKRKSRFNQEELEIRGQMVQQMQNEIQELKELALAGFVRGFQPPRGVLVTMEESEAFKGPLGSMPVNTEMTEEHRVQLQQIQQRDKELDDKYLTAIEKGVDDLRDIAIRANEGIKTTSVMIDNLDKKINEVSDHLDRVNKKMKTTLDEVGRSSDKICVDIICIIILLGMVGVIYQMVQNTRWSVVNLPWRSHLPLRFCISVQISASRPGPAAHMIGGRAGIGMKSTYISSSVPAPSLLIWLGCLRCLSSCTLPFPCWLLAACSPPSLVSSIHPSTHPSFASSLTNYRQMLQQVKLLCSLFPKLLINHCQSSLLTCSTQSCKQTSNTPPTVLTGRVATLLMDETTTTTT